MLRAAIAARRGHGFLTMGVEAAACRTVGVCEEATDAALTGKCCTASLCRDIATVRHLGCKLELLTLLGAPCASSITIVVIILVIDRTHAF
jgi:hypothetical protein